MVNMKFVGGKVMRDDVSEPSPAHAAMRQCFATAISALKAAKEELERAQAELNAKGDGIIAQAVAKAEAIEAALIELDGTSAFRGFADRVVRKALGKGLRE
jgi:ribosomal protein S9